jgi:hypothetical protein
MIMASLFVASVALASEESEVFLAAFRNRRRYDTGRDDARPWLYGIAVNVISQYQRAPRRHVRVLAAVPGVPATDVVADEVLDRVTAAQLRPRIMRVLGGLSTVTGSWSCWLPGRSCPTSRPHRRWEYRWARSARACTGSRPSCAALLDGTSCHPQRTREDRKHG